MVFGARQTGLSISETAVLLGFSCTTISRVYWEWSEKEKISREQQLCGRKCLVDVRGQRRMDRLVRDDRKTTVTQITTRYNQDLQNTISEHTTHQTLKQMDSSSRRSHRVPLLSAKNRTRRIQFTQTHQNYQITALSSSAFTTPSISHGLLTRMQCWRRCTSASSSWDGWGSLERAPESSGPSTPALWRASWPAVSPPGLETAPLATAGLCKGSCELPATLLEVSFPPSRISTPGGVQGKPGGLSKTPATRPTDCSLCCPQEDVSAASDPALADWGTAFSLRLSG